MSGGGGKRGGNASKVGLHGGRRDCSLRIGAGGGGCRMNTSNENTIGKA